MENIRLVLVDIDGTLLNSKGIVTPDTIAAVNQLREAGITFGIATGRSPYAVKTLVKEWGIGEAADIIMGFNGSGTLYLDTDEMVSFAPLSGEGIQELLHDFQGFSFNAGIYDGYGFHALKKDAIAERTAVNNHFELIIDDFTSYFRTGAPKVLLMTDKEELDRILAHYETLHPVHYRAFRSAPVLLECINPELTKSKGIAAICARMHITADQVLTFGDMMNDYEMIRDYVGVAMGNADERIKKAAKYITASNDEDGIAVFLNKYIF
ncbi:MAG: HAD family phosphatase [Solobacterium sp.]|nr:HAD family phosphatase [Solobacterium sp.]